jgi:hypothetical protein
MAYLPIESLELPSIDSVSSQTTKKLIDAIQKADRRESALTSLAYSVPGFSTVKVRCLLNQLCNYPNARYMEIGCWKGSTLTAALYNNNPEYHVAIENFVECKEITKEVYESFLENCLRVLGKHPNHINQDAFQVDTKKEGIEGINVYFYDGCHSRESTKKAITHYYDSLSDEFILLIDDWNRASVATGTIEGINEVGLKLDFVRILPANGDGDMDNWWSGMFVASCTKR